MYSWIDILISSFSLLPTNRFGNNGRLRWTKNLAHNLFVSINLTLDGKPLHTVNNYILDFLSHFNVSESKRKAYNRAIGENISEGRVYEELSLCLPLPFNTPLPMAVMPYVETRINYKLRSWDKLLTLVNIETGEKVVPKLEELSNEPIFTLSIWGNYKIVSNSFRRAMGEKPYKLVYETFQMIPEYPLRNDNMDPCIDVLLSGPVKAFLFATRNRRSPNEWSVYDIDGKDPLKKFVLGYEETVRLVAKNHHTSFIEPFFHADAVGTEGIHMYSYSEGKLSDKKSTPTTNFDKMTHTWINLEYEGDISDCDTIVVAVGKNILDIDKGSVV